MPKPFKISSKGWNLAESGHTDIDNNTANNFVRTMLLLAEIIIIKIKIKFKIANNGVLWLGLNKNVIY